MLCIFISLSIGLTWIYCCIFQRGKIIPEQKKNLICIHQSLHGFPLNPFSPQSKYLSQNFNRVDIILNEISFKHRLILDWWFWGNFLGKYDIDFLTKGKFIEGCISTASISSFVTSFCFQLISYHFSFTCDSWTIVDLV